MTVAADTFAEFVDAPRRGAGRPRGDGRGAGPRRLHFSRFHFDRMVRSVAGEPPRRSAAAILLERAAYRMITTTAPLIDIAVEAGYGSHEAFTRAFTKAYGVAPARLAHGGPATSRSRRRAASTSTHPAACGCPHETRSPPWNC